MYENEKVISICEITSEGKKILRRADIVGKDIIPLQLDGTYQGYQRDKIPHERQSTPTLMPGHLGVWEWFIDSMGKARSRHLEGYLPFEIIDDYASLTKRELAQKLKAGIELPFCKHNRLFLFQSEKKQSEDKKHKEPSPPFRFGASAFSEKNWGAALCTPSQWDSGLKNSCLREDVHILPCFEIAQKDILRVSASYDTPERQLYSRLELPAQTGWMVIRSPEYAIKQLYLDTLNKRVLMESDATRNEAQYLRGSIGQNADENMPEKIASSCHIPLEMAQACWKKFQNELALHIQGEDIGNDVLRGLLKEDDSLRQRMKEEWLEQYQGELKQTHEEILKDIEACKAQRKGLEEEKKRLAKEAEEARSKTQKELARLQQETKSAEERLEKALEEAEQAEQLRQENVEQYKKLGEDSLRLVREKLSLARKEAADFLADLALFGTPGEGGGTAVFQPALTAPASFSFQPGKKTEEKEDVQETKELLRVLQENLENAGAEHAEELAHFLFGSFQSRTHLLLAGPQGMDVADALSCAMTGRHAAVLDCCGDWTPSALDAVLVSDDTVIAVKHPFHRRWIDQLAPELDRTGKIWLFLHPYADDLVLEPAGLYSYVFPVVLDLFIVDRPYGPMVGSRKSPRYKEFGPADSIKEIKESFNTLGLKPAVKNRGRELAEWACTQMKESRKDFFRFACLLFPLAMAFDKKRDFLEILEQKNELKSSDISLLKDSLGGPL